MNVCNFCTKTTADSANNEKMRNMFPCVLFIMADFWFSNALLYLLLLLVLKPQLLALALAVQEAVSVNDNTAPSVICCSDKYFRGDTK